MSQDSKTRSDPEGKPHQRGSFNFSNVAEISVCDSQYLQSKSQTEVWAATFAEQARDQLRPSLDSELDENISQMKLHCLFAHLEPGSDRGIS